MKKCGRLFWLLVAFVLCSVPGLIAGQDFLFSSVGECGSGDYRGIAAQGNHVYNACLSPGLIVVDITNPSNPVEVSSTTVPGSAECIAVSGNYAYLGTSRGLHIVNISNPAAPTTAGYHYTSNPLERILVNGQTVYALSAAGFQVVDVSNPSNPVGRGSITFSTAIRGADAKGSILYLSLDRLTTVDASDANNPEIISQSASQISPNDIRIEGDYAYVSDFYGFDVYDISEPEVPVLLGEYYHESTSTSSQRLCVRGNYVYVQRNHQLRGNYGADIWSRVLTVDVTDKASPAGVAAGPKAYKHYHDITRSGDTVFISSPSGFRALDVSTPAEPRVAGDFTVTLDDFALSGDYAFLAEGEAGMSVWDIPVVKNRLPHQKISTTGKGSAGRQRTARGDALWREQGSPVKVAVFDDVDDASGIAIKGDFAYLRDKLRLHVLDISNPAVPETVCQYTNESGITDHMISGTTLYLLSYGNLAILDISNPASPVLVGRSATYSGGRTLTVSGDFAYIMDSEEDSYGYFHNFLEVMDISDPSVPIRVSYLEINSCNSSRMFADGDYLYFANAKGLNIYDISNAPDYHLVSITPGRNALTTYNQYGVFIEDNYAYYSGDSGFNVLDISNPSAPFNVGGVDTGGPEGPIRKEGNTVYVGDGRSLLSIYRQFDTSTSVEISTAKKRFYFASTTGGKSTSARGFYLSSRGGGDGQWQASVDKDWLTCTPVSLDYGELSIDASGLEPGSYSGTVTITGPVIINSLKLEVVLNVIASQSSAEPFGLVATPEDGDVVSGSVPFNGWVLDDIEVVKVEIALVYGNAELLIGEAALVEGARPDVEAAYPGYPRGERAGWGYMQLTRGLPRGLDGNLMFRVYASDVEGHRTLLGTRTIIVNNSVAVAPFGAIDTPLRGGTAEDTAYSNYGWVLHRSPTRFP